MEILWGVIILGITASFMEIVYFYHTKTTWIEFVYEYDKPEQKDSRVQSMYEIFIPLL